MTTIDDVPADVELELSENLQRMFRAVDCDPACHVCGRRINLWDIFVLLGMPETAEDEATDEMVCQQCGRIGFDEMIQQKLARIAQETKEREEWQKKHPGKVYGRVGAGFARPSQTRSR